MARVLILAGMALTLLFHAVAMVREPDDDSTSYRSSSGSYGSGSGGGFSGGHK
ncbi:MAG: hypothetical protein ACK41V_22960 [Acidovorax sp.]|uniref:hypothetical protein n=1 Tax=Acidovorax sp. TaxID=1872122 RepID=UPI00391AF353